MNTASPLKDVELAREVMNKEALSINKAAGRLTDSSFTKAVEILLNAKSKIVVCGIGKSGHVGKKLSATLCSTGSPACFLHPSEAVHGDLGIHQHGDPVIYLSNSGTTPELIALEPIFRSRGAKIVGLLGNVESPLGEKADVVIDASVDKEADPLGIVPTASFAVASSLGDALSSTLMKRRNFSENEYAQTHPAGQLGRNLILRVSDVLHAPNKVACVEKNTLMKDVVIKMTHRSLGAACVLVGNKLIGIVTDGDLRRGLQENENLLSLTAESIMTNNPTTISPNATLGDALHFMETGRATPVSLLPVVEDQTMNFLGLLRLHDIYGNN
jgi:arabinose-5-phosphate isomerase